MDLNESDVANWLTPQVTFSSSGSAEMSY